MSRLRYASEWDSSGYATAARRCMYALSLLPIDLSWQPLVDAGPEGRVPSGVAIDAPVALRAMRRPARSDDTLVIHCPPRSWHRIASDPKPAHIIGHTVWEADRIPRLWLTEMDDVDEFWVPTEWNRVAFAEAFKRPVHVVPHVLEFQEPLPPPVELDSDHKIISILSAWDWRKRPELTLHAALRAFDGRRDVTIVVKTGHWTTGWPGRPEDPRVRIANIVSEFPNKPRVVVATDDWSDGEVLGLLERTDCLFSLTAAEGWGLGAFDAVGIGTPVVITGHGGQVEWLGSGYPGLVPFHMVDADHPDTTLFETGMQWAAAHIDSAIDLLRAAVDETDSRIVDHTSRLREELHARYSAPAIAQKLADILPDRVIDAAMTRISSTRQGKSVSAGSLLVLTPVKNAARHAEGWADRVLSLHGSCDRLEAAVLISDSDDGSVEAFRQVVQRLQLAGVPCTIIEHDYHFRLPPDIPRWAPEYQFERRSILAKSRNRLLFSTLHDHDWVLWLDADVVAFDSDIVETMIATGADLVQPHCVLEPGGATFDLNGWTDFGAYHLDDYRGHETVELHAVGGTMLLVRAECHRDGLIWPAYPYGIDDERASDIGFGEGFGLSASATGYRCVGLPDIEVVCGSSAD